jgi:ABC-type multidrug transport system fused ATPase/permease subunit
MRLTQLVRQHRKGFFFILCLILLENVAWIIEPTLFGNLIDAFIEKASHKNLAFQMIHVLPLFLWISVYIINSGSGTFRRRFEPRVYQKMYVQIVSKIADESKDKNIAPSRTTARAQLSQEYINFLQYRVPEIFEQTISIFGAIFALIFFDSRIALTCLFISLPIIILSNLYNKNVVKLQSDLHDNYETVFEMFSNKEIDKVKNLYSLNARLQEKIAKWGSANFGIMRMILLIIFLVVLYIAIDLDNFTTGDIYSIVSYLWTFVSSVEYIPDLLESQTSLKDLSYRLRTES